MLTLIGYGFLLGVGFWLCRKLTSWVDGNFLSNKQHEELNSLHDEIDKAGSVQDRITQLAARYKRERLTLEAEKEQ